MALKSFLTRHTLVNVIYAVGICAIAMGTSFNYFSKPPVEPYVHMDAVGLTPKVPVGGPLVVRVSGVRQKLCGVWVGRGFVNAETGNMVHQELVPAGFVGLGQFSKPIEMRLPITMGPGKYIFKGIQWNDCGSEVFTTAYPDVFFEIINQD